MLFFETTHWDKPVSRPRNEAGKFVESPDSLHPKSIGLRLPKKVYPEFEALARAEGIPMTELARKACLEYLERKKGQTEK